jgi:anti-anti-sigma factor
MCVEEAALQRRGGALSMMNEFDVFCATVCSIGGRAVVTVHGEIDLVTEEEFERAVNSAMQLSPHVVIDLADMGFMDSSALKAMLKAKFALQRLGSFHLRNVPRQAMVVLNVAGLAGLLCDEDQGSDTEATEPNARGRNLDVAHKGGEVIELADALEASMEAGKASRSRHPTSRPARMATRPTKSA